MVWLSRDLDRYPATAIKRVIGPGIHGFPSRREFATLAGGLFRLVFDADSATIIPWKEAKSICRMPNKLQRALVRSAKERGERPADWYCSFEPLCVADALSLDQWVDGVWTQIDATTADFASTSRINIIRDSEVAALGL
ncbi:hypothetical protein A3709_20740 [Halioglobus sp. HI00S01]|nr:hypothetical protein A3709_20740 [Halioglobus sp. HI00S01]